MQHAGWCGVRGMAMAGPRSSQQGSEGVLILHSWSLLATAGGWHQNVVVGGSVHIQWR